MLHALLACTGLSPGNLNDFRLLPEFEEGRIVSPSYGDGAPMFYRLDNGQVAPHNMFTNTDALWAEATERGINKRQEIRAWTFSTNAPANGRPADTIEVNYKALDNRTEWRWDETAGAYARWQAGYAFTDRLTGEQTTADNVIVAYAVHIDTLVQEDVSGAKSVEIQLWGEGDLILFRDGQAYPGRWKREDSAFLFQVYDKSGNLLPLKPGNTWVEMVYATATDTTTNSGGAWAVESMQKP
jgi:hypothetical protein